MAARQRALAGRRILLVEDEFFLADDLARTFETEGAEVVGPAASVEDALQLVASASHLDGAVLDINLRGELVFPVAEALQDRGITFLFATGYDAAAIPPRFAHVRRCQKPFDSIKEAMRIFA